MGVSNIDDAISDESYRDVHLNKSYSVKYRKRTMLHSKKLKNYMPTNGKVESLGAENTNSSEDSGEGEAS